MALQISGGITFSGGVTVNFLPPPVVVQYLVVGGGGGGGAGNGGGGGGAGGMVTGCTALNSATTYSIVVGCGGIGGVGYTAAG